LGAPEAGPIFTGLFGAWLVAAPLIMLSLFACLHARSQVGGLLGSLAATLGFLLIGTQTVAQWFAAVPGFGWLPSTVHVTLLGAFNSFAVGLFNLSAVLLVVGMFLVVMALILGKKSWMFSLSGLLCIIIAMLPGTGWMQLDTTSQNRFTPNASTISTLRNLGVPVTFTLYLSQDNPDLPQALHAYTKQLKNMLLRIRAETPRHVQIRMVNTDSNPESAIKALQSGATEQSLPTGTTYFAALDVEIGGNHATIPALNTARIGVQEYDIVTLINQALTNTKPQVAVLAANTGAQQAWEKHLPNFSFTNLTPESEIPTDIAAIVIPSDADFPKSNLENLTTYLGNGGNILLLTDAYSRSENLEPSAGSTFSSLLPQWGMTLISTTVVADPDLATLVTQNKAGTMAYPYWLQLGTANINGSLPFTAGLTQVNLKEAGELHLTEAPNLTVTPIFTSSPQASAMPMDLFLNTPPQLANTNLTTPTQPRVLAAIASGKFGERATRSGKLITIADTDWLTQPEADNALLMSNLLDFLSGQSNLEGLSAKGAAPRTLTRVEGLTTRLTRATAKTETDISTRLANVNKDDLAAAKEEEFMLRFQLREVRSQTRHSLQKLENGLLLANLALMPTLTGLFFFFRRRRQKRKAAQS
ncbi:MAG: hypothetical protein DI585_06905, partial [Pseudomonas fluorescens]